MSDKRISQLVERVTIANNDVLPIVALNAATTNKVTISTIQDWMQTHMDLGVTSISVNTSTSGSDITISGSPITSTGTITINIPTASATKRGALSSADWSTFNGKQDVLTFYSPLQKNGVSVTIDQADTDTNGYLSYTDWNTFNNKEGALTKGNLTETISGVLTITGGTAAVIGTGTTIEVKQASGSQDGFLDSADWTTFNNKVSTSRSISTTAPLQGGGDLSANRTLSITQSGSASNGYLSSTDWNTFNNKQNALSGTGVVKSTAGTISYINGVATQYIDGTGSLQTFPSIIGTANNLTREVYNETGATLVKGTVVYINGGHGNLPTIAKALATGDSTSAQTYGVVQTDIGNMSNGFIVVIGDLFDMPTNGYAIGTQLYLSSTTAGEFTSTKQYAPAHLVYVGIVTRSHPTQGVIAVKIQNGYEMDELHDVSARNPDNNDILQFKIATGLWTKVAGSTTNIAEGTNLYYTDARSRGAFSESVTGLDYNSTTGVLSTTAGYGIPTTASQSNWDAAYNDKINSAAVTGTTTKTLTLTQQDGGTITASWTDINTDAVSSVFGRTGAVVAVSGDYTTAQVTESGNLYFTNGRARSAISLTTTGSSGAASYSDVTGILNVPTYTLSGLGGEPTIAAGTTAQYWRGDKSWQTLNTANVPELTNLYFTDARARAAISLTTTGTSGAATYSGGVLNIPQYQGVITNPVTGTGTTHTIPKWSNTTGGLNDSILSQGTTAQTYINISKDQNNPTALQIQNLTNGTAAQAHVAYISQSGNFNMGKLSATFTPVLGINSADGYILNQGSGNIVINNQFATGGIRFIVNGNTTASTVINDLGRVGLNIEAPTNLLHLAGASATPSLRLGSVSVGYHWDIGRENATTGDFLFNYTENGTLLGTLARLKTNANFGINCDPTQLIDSYKSFNGDIAIRVKNDNANSSATAQFFAHNGTNQSQFFHTGTAYAATETILNIASLGGIFNTAGGLALVAAGTGGHFSVSTGGYSTRFHISSTGNIGFGTRVPSSYSGYKNYSFQGGVNGANLDFLNDSGARLGYVVQDPNGLYIGTFTENPIEFRINDVMRVKITNAASRAELLVGTATCAFSSTGRGVVEVNGSSNAVLGFKVGDAAVGYLYHSGGDMLLNNTTTTGSLKFATKALDRLIITKDGQLANNTDVTTGVDGATFYTRPSSNNQGQTAFVIQGYDKTNRWAINGQNGADLYDFAIFSAPTGANDWTQRFTITAAGDVRVGTAVSGGGKFQVNGDININGNFKINGTIIGGGGGSGVTGSGTANYITKWSGASSLVNSIMYDTGTQIIIGATSATNGSRFEVKGNGVWDGAVVTLTNTGTGGKSFSMFSTNSSFSQGSGKVLFYNGTTGEERDLGVITSTGNWVLGSSADYAYRLAVAGSIYATGDIIAYSDISVKTNIRTIENALEKIINSRGVIYDRTDNDDKNNIGFIAQELEKQFPELIATNPDGTKGVKYQNAVAVLFEAIKEQQTQINELKKQIA